MNMYDKAFNALVSAGFSPDMVGTPDDPCIYVNVWTDDMGEAPVSYTDLTLPTKRIV